MRFRSIIGIIINFTIILALSCGNENSGREGESNSDYSQNDVKEKAYSFSLQTLKGKAVTLADYKGKILLLNIWDTWCAPCRAEIPAFVELYEQYNPKGFEILGVAIGQQGRSTVEKFIKEYGVNYPNALADRVFFTGVGDVNNIPTTFLIDGNGRIIKTYIGSRPKDVFENDIKQALKSHKEI